jgi:hypothetical protein
MDQNIHRIVQDILQAQQAQQQILQDIQQTLQDVQQNEKASNRRFVVIENGLIQIRNRGLWMANVSATLTPLRDLVTGDVIPNCPTTFSQAYKLTGAEATRILQALQVPVPGGLEAKRLAVQGELC